MDFAFPEAFEESQEFSDLAVKYMFNLEIYIYLSITYLYNLDRRYTDLKYKLIKPV